MFRLCKLIWETLSPIIFSDHPPHRPQGEDLHDDGPGGLDSNSATVDAGAHFLMFSTVSC